MEYLPIRFISAVRAALLCRCPYCLIGKLYVGYLTVAEKCDNCKLDLNKYEAGDGPAVFVVLLVGAVVVGLALWVEISYQPAYWIHGAIWIPLIIGLCLGSLRWAKALIIVLHIKNKVHGFDT